MCVVLSLTGDGDGLFASAFRKFRTRDRHVDIPFQPLRLQSSTTQSNAQMKFSMFLGQFLSYCYGYGTV